MKKILILLVLLLPALAFATNNTVTIQPIIPVCGEQDIPVVVNATYGRNDGRIVTYLNGVKVDHYNHKPATIIETIHVVPGTYQFRARTYLWEINSNWFVGRLAEANQTFTVVACDVPPPPPVDVCPNLEGAQATVPDGYTLSEGNCIPDVVEETPIDLCPNIEGDQGVVPDGMSLIEGSCVTTPAEELEPVVIMGGTGQASHGNGGGSTPSTRLCYLTGGAICIPWDKVTPELSQIMLQLCDLIIQRNQILSALNNK